MIALLLVLALFAGWWLIGLAVLVLVRAEIRSLRVALTAPIVGTATTVLPLFTLSSLGVAMEDVAVPVTIVLLGGAAAVLAIRRPKIPLSVAPVIAACLGGLLLAAWPLFQFGFGWLAYANEDMANYVLSATYLLHHGLLAPVDLVGLSHNSDYVSVSSTLHLAGSRPGADITLAALTGLTGKPAYETFMPFVLALDLCAICGAAALAMQAARRWWAASAAAVFIAVSPQATYGELLQLMPQVWGLGLAAAFCSLAMRRELYRGRGSSMADVIPISLIAVALVVVYVELASTIALAYALYIGVLIVRRELELRPALRLWVPALAFAAIVLNTYGSREFTYVQSQASAGVHGLFQGPPNWGYTLLPSALTGILGVQVLPALSRASMLQWWIAASAIALLGVLVGAIWTALRGMAASVVLVAYSIIGLYLGYEASDFGLFKLFMYVQPFLAAALAVWLAGIARTRILALVAVPVVALLAVQLSTQQAYVGQSLNPNALRDASSDNLLPRFRQLVAENQKPLITVTDNPVLAKLEAVIVGQRPLYLMTQSVFVNLFDVHPSNVIAARLSGWQPRSFPLKSSASTRVDPFWENTHTSALFAQGKCTIVLPKGNQIVLNRRSLPEETGDLIAEPCDRVRNTLVFTASKLGWGFSDFDFRDDVALYPPQPDFADPGHTFSGIGRYILLRVLNPSPKVRVEVNLTSSDVERPLPPAAIVGKLRTPLALTGSGSARVFSPPLNVTTVDGQPYLLLDMGRNGTLPAYPRSGIEAVYGKSVPVDPRYLTAFLRDISIVTVDQYVHMKRPSAIRSFPSGLADQNLEYSGIYEDGWVARRSYVVLAGGPATTLDVRALAPWAQGLRILANGRQVLERHVAAGELDLRVSLPASSAPRRIELRWSSARVLSARDARRASALLQSIALSRPAAG